MIFKLKKYRKILILSTIVFFFIIFFEIFPAYSTVVNLALDYFDQKSIVENKDTQKSKIDNLISENKLLKLQINNYVSDFEENRNISSVINFLDSNAVKYDIKINSLKPQNLVEKDNLWLQPIQLTFNSTYSKIFNYVRDIESSGKVVIIKNISVTPDEPLSSDLEFSAQLEVYLNL